MTYRALKRPLMGCDTGVIVPRRGKLISLLRSSLGYVCMLAHACEHKRAQRSPQMRTRERGGPSGGGGVYEHTREVCFIVGLLIVLSQ